MPVTTTGCLDHASQCEWYAAHTNDERDRKFLLRMAKHWTKQARKRDRRQRLARPSAKAMARTLRRSKKLVRGLEERLPEVERYAVADHAGRSAQGSR
jgi:hypothetical protein